MSATVGDANRIARQLDAAMNAAGDRTSLLSPPTVVHLVTPSDDAWGVTRCCGVTLEVKGGALPGDSLTIDPSKVTCRG